MLVGFCRLSHVCSSIFYLVGILGSGGKLHYGVSPHAIFHLEVIVSDSRSFPMKERCFWLLV